MLPVSGKVNTIPEATGPGYNLGEHTNVILAQGNALLYWYMNTYGILKHFLNNNKKLQEKNRNNTKNNNDKPHGSTASCFVNVIHKVPWEQVVPGSKD